MDEDENYENWVEKNLVIAIPTLGRPKSILKHTLSLFTDRFKDKIIIYLQDNEKPNNIMNMKNYTTTMVTIYKCYQQEIFMA